MRQVNKQLQYSRKDEIKVFAIISNSQHENHSVRFHVIVIIQKLKHKTVRGTNKDFCFFYINLKKMSHTHARPESESDI